MRSASRQSALRARRRAVCSAGGKRYETMADSVLCALRPGKKKPAAGESVLALSCGRDWSYQASSVGWAASRSGRYSRRISIASSTASSVMSVRRASRLTFSSDLAICS